MADRSREVNLARSHCVGLMHFLLVAFSESVKIRVFRLACEECAKTENGIGCFLESGGFFNYNSSKKPVVKTDKQRCYVHISVNLLFPRMQP